MTPMDLIKKEEGVRKYAYLDSLCIWTTGMGFNLERKGANDVLRKNGINPDLIWAAIEEAKKAGGGRKPNDHTIDVLTDAQIDALAKLDVDEAVADVRKLIQGYDQYPENARAVLASMRFQLGAAGIRAFKNTVKAFQDKRWKDAAKGMRASLAYKQTPERWERAAKMIEVL